MTSPVTVWVPTATGPDLLGELPDHVTVEVWAAGQPRPDGPTPAFLVPPFLGAGADLTGLPDLKVVQLLSAGAEVFLPLVPDGVTLCTARGAHTGSTAEWTLTAILAATRDFPAFHRTQSEGRWSPHVSGTVAGQRVLVLGYGDIGRRVADLLRSLGAEVTGVSRSGKNDSAPLTDLPTLLPGADVVVLLLPLTPETEGLVDAAFLAGMKSGALLVNAARGKVVDTDALIQALQDGRVTAALDVTDPEPLPEGHPLWSAPGLLLTPHVAGAVEGQEGRAYAVARANLLRWLAGEPLHNVVDRTAGY